MAKEKPWRECGDYISKLPETRALGVIVLPEGAIYTPLRAVDKLSNQIRYGWNDGWNAPKTLS